MRILENKVAAYSQGSGSQEAKPQVTSLTSLLLNEVEIGQSCKRDEQLFLYIKL